MPDTRGMLGKGYDILIRFGTLVRERCLPGMTPLTREERMDLLAFGQIAGIIGGGMVERSQRERAERFGSVIDPEGSWPVTWRLVRRLVGGMRPA